MGKVLDEIEKKANRDIKIILISTIIPILIYIFFGEKIMEFGKNESTAIWPMFFLVALIQFGLAGLGMSIVMISRKESFMDYGLIKDNLIVTIILSLIAFVPHFLFLNLTNDVNGYFPLGGMFLTEKMLNQSFPLNILSYSLIGLIWGFFEGLNYVVISQKINERYPTDSSWFNKGAITCGMVCVLIHGMVGIDLNSILEASTTFVFIYGLLMIKEHTNNSWGMVFSFMFLWNAF